MSDFVAAAAALRTRLEEFDALPLYWPNDDRTPTLENAPNGFVYSEIRLLDERQMTLAPTGDRTHRDFGELAIYVYVPAGSLVGTAEAHAQTIRNLFKLDAIDGVYCTRRTIGAGQSTGTPATPGRFWGVPVIVEFFTDRTE